MRTGPQFVGHRSPILRCLFAFGRQLPNILRGLQIRGVCAGPLHSIHQRLGIVQQRAGPQVVPIPWLAFLISGKQRRLQSLQQGVGANVGIGIVDERTGLIVSAGIDMQIQPSAGQAAA